MDIPNGINEIALIGFRGLMLQALFATPNSLLKPLKKNDPSKG